MPQGTKNRIDGNDMARAKLDEARSTQDRLQKYGLLKEASAAVEDKGLQVEIEREFTQLKERMKPSVQIRLGQLKDRENYEQFIASLRMLENLLADYEFSSSDEELIRDARNWFDQKRRRDGARTSKVALGGLKDKFTIYELTLRSPEATFSRDMQGKDLVSKDVYLEELRKSWITESANVTDKLLSDAKHLAVVSPSAARAALHNALHNEIDFYVEDENRTLRIKDYPLSDPDTERIKAAIDVLAKPCEQETVTVNLRDKATGASSPYVRYELLVQAREPSWSDPTSFVLPGLDKAIRDGYDEAARTRCDEIRASLSAVQFQLKQLAELGRDVVTAQLADIEKSIESIRFEINKAWPGAGRNLDIDGEAPKIERPAQLEELRREVEKTGQEFIQLRTAYEKLIAQDENIRRLLEASDAEKRQEGLREFAALSTDELISKSLIFKSLEGFKVQQTSFEDGEQTILKHYNNEEWPVVLQLCRDFRSKSNYERKCPKEIREKVSLWERTAKHRLLLKRLQDLVAVENYAEAEKTLKQLKSEKLDWEPVKAYVEKIESVKRDGSEMVDFYRKSISTFPLDGHIILEILRDPDGIFERKIDAKDRKIIQSILGEGKGQVSNDQYEENVLKCLSDLLKRVSFDQKSELLEKINHVAGRS